MTVKGPSRVQQLGEFLRARREALPAPARSRARTPGLRREDVAALGAISVDYYTRLEQGRAASMPSPAVTDALADALELTAAGRAHLHRLTGRAAPEATQADSPVPGLVFLMDNLGDVPAQVVNDLGDVLAQNSAADRLFPWIVAEGLGRANVYERWFCHEPVRAAFPADQRDAYSAAQAGELRAAATRRDLAGDPRGRQFVSALMERSGEFQRAWDAQHVYDGRDKQIWTASNGGSALHAHVTVDDHTNQRLIAFEYSVASDI
ncbi:helix-turn-helix transcriptional regulator [Nocardioidaceae bacterium SCSIO 66511]|nr:helix-turn-helix transcriptional regulator [Nocardioidaceae bacterium SCSIO 66511]